VSDDGNIQLGKQGHRSCVIRNVLLLPPALANEIALESLFLQCSSFRADGQQLIFDPTTCHLLQEAFLTFLSVLAKYPVQSGSTAHSTDFPQLSSIRCISYSSVSEAYLAEGGLWPEKGFFLRAHSCSVADKIHNS